jgi:glycosyltransferase involved in cell wall biosynthesis
MVSEHASPLAALGGVDAGGQNVHVAALSLALAELGHQVDVYTRRDRTDVPAQVAIDPAVTVHHVPAGPPEEVPKDELVPHLGELACGLERCWRSRTPDVVHAHFWMSALCALDAAPAGTPVVQTFHALGVVKRRHQGAADTSPRCRLAAERQIAARATRIIATCSDEAFELRRMGAERHRISIVPCGVDLHRFRPDGPAERRVAGRRRIVCVSRLVDRKGLDDVIRALPRLPGYELVIAGGPPAAALGQDPVARHLWQVAGELGVADRVELRGSTDRDAIPALLRSADAVCCTPWYEPFGIVPLEAMACGVPVVASAVGGLVDSVVHGVTGLHVPPRSPRAVADAVAAIVERPQYRAELAAGGLRRVRTRYGWPRIAQATFETYALALATPVEPAEVYA